MFYKNTQFKKYEDSVGVWTPLTPLWVRQWQQYCLVWISLDTWALWLHLVECLYYCMLFSSRDRVNVWVTNRFIVWFVSGYAPIQAYTISAVIVTLSIAYNCMLNLCTAFGTIYCCITFKHKVNQCKWLWTLASRSLCDWELHGELAFGVPGVYRINAARLYYK